MKNMVRRLLPPRVVLMALGLGFGLFGLRSCVAWVGAPQITVVEPPGLCHDSVQVMDICSCEKYTCPVGAVLHTELRTDGYTMAKCVCSVKAPGEHL